MATSQQKSMVTLAIVAIVAVVAMTVLLQPKEPTSGEKIGNAIDELADGVKDAGRELKPHRSPTEKIGDAIEDAGRSIEDAGQ